MKRSSVHMAGILCVVAAGFVALPAALGQPDVNAAVPSDARAVLAMGGYWRWYTMWQKPVVPMEMLRAAGKDASGPVILPTSGRPFTSRPDEEHLETAPPPADWASADFDDAGWARRRGSFDGLLWSTGLVCVRGKFQVTDPAKVNGLFLSLAYRGGVVVYLNGKEIARKDMPEGPITPRTPAVMYAEKAWLDAQGKLLQNPSRVARRIKAGETSLVGRIESRTRRLGPVRLPPDALRKGTNVLAVEVHRTDYHPIALTMFAQKNMHDWWMPIALTDLRLKAVGGGVVPNVVRPRGVQVWNADIHDRLTAGDFGGPAEPLRPMRIVAARNGAYSGQFVVSGTDAIRGISVTAGDLAAASGNGTIPASAVSVRYVLMGDISRKGTNRRTHAFDGLSERAPAEVTVVKPPADTRRRAALGLPPRPVPAAVQPVWVTVEVPRDAVPGEYRGSVTVSAKGIQPVRVPIELSVADWVVPDPLQFRTVATTYQSPASLAMQYNVELWSEEHWALMEKSYALLAQIGNDLVNIPVVAQAQMGNDEGMIRWVKRPGGGYDHDFSTFDRYIELVKKHLGSPRFVVLHVWHCGGWETKKRDQKNQVTVVDPKTGKRDLMQVPIFATPESKAFWKSVLLAIKDRLTKAGMAKGITLGTLSDGTAPAEVFAMFRSILPDAGWHRGCHSVAPNKPVVLKGGGKVVAWEFCYGAGIHDPTKKRRPIWDPQGPGIMYFRSDFDTLSPYSYHRAAERSLYVGTMGVGRNCLDYWDFKQGRRMNNLYNRWPHSSSGQREPTITHMAYAGVDGPLSSVRFDLLREGLQDAEAMIVVAEAASKHADRIGPYLAAKCRRLVEERTNAARLINGVGNPIAWHYTNWQDANARLYAVAAEVAASLGQR